MAKSKIKGVKLPWFDIHGDSRFDPYCKHPKNTTFAAKVGKVGIRVTNRSANGTTAWVCTCPAAGMQFPKTLKSLTRDEALREAVLFIEKRLTDMLGSVRSLIPNGS